MLGSQAGRVDNQAFTQASTGPSLTRCKYLTGYNLILSREGNGKPQENYNGEDIFHSNRVGMALEEEEDLLFLQRKP